MSDRLESLFSRRMKRKGEPPATQCRSTAPADTEPTDLFAPHPQGLLSQRHPHPKDGHVLLDDETHVYTYNGPEGPTKVGVSCSKLTGVHFDDFDALAVAEAGVDKWLDNSASPNHALAKYLLVRRRMSREQVVQEFAEFWLDVGRDAADSGTEMHKRIETFINGVYVPTEEERQGEPPHDLECFIKLWEGHYPSLRLRPYRTEFSMVYVDDVTGRPVVAGQADGIFVDKHGDYHLFDWKRCDPKNGLIGEQALTFCKRGARPKMASGPFAAHECNKYVKYSAQMHLYAHILSTQYDIHIKPSHIWIVQIHPKLDNAHVVEAMDLREEVQVLLREAVNAARLDAGSDQVS